MKKAFYRGIPCYFDIMTSEIKGRDFITDVLLQIMIWMDVNVFQVDGFPIEIEDED